VTDMEVMRLSAAGIAVFVMAAIFLTDRYPKAGGWCMGLAGAFLVGFLIASW